MHLVQRVQSFLLNVCLPFSTVLAVQSFVQVKQLVQSSGLNAISFLVLNDSGLWHHTHLKGQPLKNTVVLIPSPSCVSNLLIAKIIF